MHGTVHCALCTVNCLQVEREEILCSCQAVVLFGNNCVQLSHLNSFLEGKYGNISVKLPTLTGL